ncbi:hypothetical protein MMC28_009498 [Mycoblastus sanguinarius]|nr:hypothetical protein [Mycoblastus sanguinarius]
MSMYFARPVWIGRSDGELDIKTKKHGREANAPTADQLDRQSSEDDYYELLPVYHEIAIEWKRILGTLLHREQGGPPDQNWMLVDFPENYRLYKHIKKDRNPTGESSKPTKSNTKNSFNKLEDAFLYGYPRGRHKRFRSAYEFFPHLLWLTEGKSEDPDDCTCKHCAPTWVQDVQPLPGRDGFSPLKKETPPVKKEPAQVKKEPVPVKKENFATYPQVVVKQLPQRSVSQDTIKVPKPAAKVAPPVAKIPPPPNPPVPRAAAPPIVTPTSLPAAKSYEQDQDAHYGKYIYRPGELTWFNRGTAWGLSVIIKRDLFKDQRNQDRPRYLVQPLSHPFNHPAAKIISTEEDLRPWLAWSAPGPTHQSLSAANFNYNTVDWKAVLEGRYGGGDAEVDGSIFAAKMIDDSFTLVQSLSNNTTTTGERSYNGIFFGGEKIWVGEPVRLRISNGQDVMIVHQIMEKLKPNSTNIASATVFVVGDIYRYTTVPYTVGQEPAENPNLPIRLRQDLDYRNRITIASKRSISYWKIISAAARLGVADIKGRWYESSILLPILHGAPNFQQDLQRGELTDVGNWINGRGDANGAPVKPGTRYRDRLEAIGKAVPTGTKISKGLDGPPEENVFPTNAAPAAPPPSLMVAQPAPEVGASQGQQAHQGVSDGDIADFMDLDRMEDGFAQNYVEHGGQF